MVGKKIRKFLKKNKPNSGFTLTELLVGLFMSAFVTGALGFGLIQILRTTSSEQAKSNARRDTSRAIEFISDEIRRARTIELDATNANRPTALDANETLVLALDIPEVTGGRVIYYLDTNLGNWQGPQVLYRWGPPLDANGNYTNVATVASWTDEALIDGIDNTTAVNPCGGGDTLTPGAPRGFYACVNAARTSAQLYLTGGIDTVANNGTSNDSSYTAATQVVARAKDATVTSALAAPTIPIFFRSLGADFVCDSSTGENWTMRMDFNNSLYENTSTVDNQRVDDGNIPTNTRRTTANLNSSTRWIHDENRKPQPINIDETNDLTIFNVPVNSTKCGSRNVNEAIAETKPLATFTDSEGNEIKGILEENFNLSYTIKFSPNVSNRPDGNDSDPNFWTTFNGDNSATGYNNPNVTGDGRVLVFKNGSRISPSASINTSVSQADAPLYPGFDPDGPGADTDPPKDTLGKFLRKKGFAKLVSGTEGNGDEVYEIENLGGDERIIAFELGQTDNGSEGIDYDGDGDNDAHPGFDITDNVVLLRSEAFGRDNASTP